MYSFRLLYDEWLHRQPLLTRMVTSSVLFGLGDRLVQRVEKIGKSDKELAEIAKDSIIEEGQLLSESAAKTVRMMVWGGLFLSPMMHTWYNLMERVIVGTGKLVAAKKVVADMVFVAPQMPIWFFTSTGVMTGKPFQRALGDAVEKQPMMLMANYMLWPAVNSITYGVMPLEYRLLVANVVNVGWASALVHGHPPRHLAAVPAVRDALRCYRRRKNRDRFKTLANSLSVTHLFNSIKHRETNPGLRTETFLASTPQHIREHQAPSRFCNGSKRGLRIVWWSRGSGTAGIAAMRRLGLLYDGWLRRAPVTTKCITSAFLFGLGDRIAQRVEKSRAPKDDELGDREPDDGGALVSARTARTMRMVLWGGVIFAPIAHKWVNFVERTVGSHGKVVVFKKMLLDMFVLAPSLNTLFFTTTQAMEGRSPSQGFDFAVDRLPQTLKANYMIWPAANIVNYGFVPLQYRILFINCVNLVWTTVLSTISSRPAGAALIKDDTVSVREEAEAMES